MKKTVVTVFIAMLAFTTFAQANDAVLEQVMLLRFAEEAGVSDYGMIDVLQGYKEYRSMMDDLAADRAEASAALSAAIEANEDSSKLMTLTRELMDIDMNILETQQSAVSEAGSVLGSKAVGSLYLLISNMDKAKADLLAELSGKPASCCANCPMAGTAACPMAAQACAAAPACTATPAAAVKPEEAIMERVMVFLNKLVAKDLDGAMASKQRRTCAVSWMTPLPPVIWMMSKSRQMTPK